MSAPQRRDGFLVVSPPVMVSRSIDTRTLPGVIVTTGPPPLTIVAPARAPTSETLFLIVIPPANLPFPIVTVAPAGALSSAAWIVRRQPAPLPTQTVAGSRREASAGSARATTSAKPPPATNSLLIPILLPPRPGAPRRSRSRVRTASPPARSRASRSRATRTRRCRARARRPGGRALPGRPFGSRRRRGRSRGEASPPSRRARSIWPCTARRRASATAIPGLSQARPAPLAAPPRRPKLLRSDDACAPPRVPDPRSAQRPGGRRRRCGRGAEAARAARAAPPEREPRRLARAARRGALPGAERQLGRPRAAEPRLAAAQGAEPLVG